MEKSKFPHTSPKKNGIVPPCSRPERKYCWNVGISYWSIASFKKFAYSLAVSWNCESRYIVGDLTGSEFPSNEVRSRLEQRIKGENQTQINSLQKPPESIYSDVNALKQKRDIRSTKHDTVKILEPIIEKLKHTPAQDKPGKRVFSLDGKCWMFLVLVQKMFPCADGGWNNGFVLL